METKPQYMKRLRTELTELGGKIEEKIASLDKLSAEINQGYEELENPLADKQALTEVKLQESLMSGDEVWHFIWDNVWGAVKGFNRQATTESERNYQELESALQARQSALQVQLQLSKMSGEEVWDAVWKAVWNVVWSVVEEFNRQKSIEVKQVGEELQPLLDKQAALQSELHEVLMSGDAFYNVLKGTTSAMVEGESS